MSPVTFAGGISPLGKRRLPTVIDVSAGVSDTVFVGGGRRGLISRLRRMTWSGCARR